MDLKWIRFIRTDIVKWLKIGVMSRELHKHKNLKEGHLYPIIINIYTTKIS